MSTLIQVHLKRRDKSNKCNQSDFASLHAGNSKRHLKMHSGEKLNQCNQCDYVYSDPSTFKKKRQVKQMQPKWLCIFSGRWSEETFENTQWRKNQEVQPVWICLFWSNQLEETFEDTQWRKVKQMQPKWLCIFSGSQFEGLSEETQLQFGDNLNIFVNIWMYTISVCVWHKLYQFIEISPRSKFIWHCTHPGTI